MTLQGKSSAILIAAVMLAGIIFGFAGSTIAYRYGLLRMPGEGPLERMDRVLKLTPPQREQIGEVMEDTRDKVHGLHQALRSQRRQLLVDAYAKIRSLLNPDQQKEFDRNFVPPHFRGEWEHRKPPGGGMQLFPRPAQPPH